MGNLPCTAQTGSQYHSPLLSLPCPSSLSHQSNCNFHNRNTVLTQMYNLKSINFKLRYSLCGMVAMVRLSFSYSHSSSPLPAILINKVIELRMIIAARCEGACYVNRQGHPYSFPGLGFHWLSHFCPNCPSVR